MYKNIILTYQKPMVRIVGHLKIIDSCKNTFKTLNISPIYPLYRYLKNMFNKFKTKKIVLSHYTTVLETGNILE